jgi:hypothetical protein
MLHGPVVTNLALIYLSVISFSLKSIDAKIDYNAKILKMLFSTPQPRTTLVG